jgi:predicted Zn-dependent protease
VSGPLLAPERLVAMARLNAGAYDDLVEAYLGSVPRGRRGPPPPAAARESSAVLSAERALRSAPLGFAAASRPCSEVPVPARAKHFALFACAVALAMACGAPARRPAPRPRPEIVLRSEVDDRRAGEDAAKEVEAELGLVQDPELVAYVSQVGQRLARFAPARDFEYRFHIVDQETPNAFALPGGQIYVSRGLLILANSEIELANVIGHEIVHAALRHASARQAVLASIPGLFRFSAAGAIASYSRNQEREADREGQRLAGRAGYDPDGMASFLKDLDYTERLHLGASRLPSFYDTHPTTGERAAEASARAQAISWQARPPIAADTAAYLARIDGLAVGTRASEGVFQKGRFLHSELDLSLRFPEGWETKNTRRAVGAISPRRDAQVFLEMQGKGEDPLAAAQEFLEGDEAVGLRLEAPPQPIRLGPVEAARGSGSAEMPGGSVRAHLTWVAYRGTIYRLTGLVASPSSAKYEGVFRSVARSFRALTPRERESIRETRLRIVEARVGETLGELSRRTGNRWNVQQTAVMNDLFADAPLRESQRIKVAVSERYEAAPALPAR